MALEKGEFRKIFGRSSDFLRIVETQHQRPCEYPLHRHDAHEFLFVLTGKGRLRVGDHLVSLAANDLVFLKSGQPHQILDGPTDLIHRYSLYFKEDFFGREEDGDWFLKDLARLAPFEVHLSARGNAFLADHLLLFRELFFEFSRKSPGAPLLQKAKLVEIMVSFERARLTRHAGTPRPSIERRILALMEDLGRNFFRPVSLREAAGRIPLGERQFSRLFKKVSGENFVKYLNRIRILAARKILSEKGHIAGAAFETGFENLPYFYRVFKAETGRTPGDFIRRKKVPPSDKNMA